MRTHLLVTPLLSVLQQQYLLVRLYSTLLRGLFENFWKDGSFRIILFKYKAKWSKGVPKCSWKIISLTNDMAFLVYILCLACSSWSKNCFVIIKIFSVGWIEVIEIYKTSDKWIHSWQVLIKIVINNLPDFCVFYRVEICNFHKSEVRFWSVNASAGVKAR